MADEPASRRKRHGRVGRDRPRPPMAEASALIREELHQLGERKRDPQAAKQAIAAGLSKARRKRDTRPPGSEGT